MAIHLAQQESDNGLSVDMGQAAVAALRLLQEATAVSNGAAHEHWQGALGMSALAAVGANDAVVRWLLRQGLVEHCIETTRQGARRRTFRPGGSSLEKRSCFVLSDMGQGWALAGLAGDGVGLSRTGGKCQRRKKPHWDAGQGCLEAGGEVVRHYPPQAHNLIALLAAFEEWAWQRLPQWLDDPLTGKGDVDRRRRLYEAVVALNRDQRPWLVEFLVHHNKTAVGWRWREEPSGTTEGERSP